MPSRIYLVANLFCGAGGSSTGAQHSITARGYEMEQVGPEAVVPGARRLADGQPRMQVPFAGPRKQTHPCAGPDKSKGNT